MKVPASLSVILLILTFVAVPPTAPSAQQATERFARVFITIPTA